MLKAIHAQESREAALEKAKRVVEDLKAMRLRKATELGEDKIAETPSYYAYPQTHWLKLRTNNPMEWLKQQDLEAQHSA